MLRFLLSRNFWPVGSHIFRQVWVQDPMAIQGIVSIVKWSSEKCLKRGIQGTELSTTKKRGQL
jgi:hypothetical protein